MKNFIAITQFILVLFGFMLCGLFLTGLCGTIPIGAEGSFGRQWLVFASQNILAFILPAMAAWKICFHRSPLVEIEACSWPKGRMLTLAFVVFLLAVPALNQIVYLNQEIHLPDSLSSLEDVMRDMEKAAEAKTKALLESPSAGVAIVNILIIGVLTGIGEEFFFRGALQRMLTFCQVNPHVAVWTAAVVFSAMHFQFFGFIPRMLLGAWFGYLYLWSRNIWVNSFAHALNNSFVIVSAWLIGRNMVAEDFDMLGVSCEGFPWMALASAAVTTIVIIAFLKFHRHASQKQ